MTARVVRCPHCGTAFKVVADQLRLRAGWVRCGVCGEVFDAREPGEHKPVAPAAPAPAPASEPGFSADFPIAEQPARRDATPGLREPIFAAGPAERRTAQGKLPPLGGSAAAPAASEEPFFKSLPDTSDTIDEFDELDEFDADNDPRDYGRHDHPFGASAHVLPPVLRRGQPSAFARVCWSAGLLVALLVLSGQALWWWRTPIATYAPILRPALEQACAALGCTVGYVRNPQQLSIESSSVQPRTGQPLAGESTTAQDGGNGQQLVLSALLRNRASHAQPWPALELSLTDYSDTVVMRRALMPRDYLRGEMAQGPFEAHLSLIHI